MARMANVDVDDIINIASSSFLLRIDLNSSILKRPTFGLNGVGVTSIIGGKPACN